ncbi:hypothetical protein CYMTET_36396 [Cymbomonas tetramitiformis]|uniref:Uncharacterized protein n=1 Tax=Cymbomonas tetramitiformis TaxID=36881 RepID=A0AAE0CHA9_9CHLO|nr:hypothetical protein CYMTET_36396 [Cymbomonas tetramitiformis]
MPPHPINGQNKSEFCTIGLTSGPYELRVRGGCGEAGAQIGPPVQVVCSTEDIRWGSLVTGGADAKSLDAGLFTQMPARQLKELQEEAMEKKDLLFKGVMVIMPIMLPSGKCWGCISHILKRSACKYLLDGFPTPKVNNVPKAIQCIKLLCVGIRRSWETIEKVRLAHEMNDDGLEVSEHDPLADKRAKMGELLTKINVEKRQLMQGMMKNEKKMYSALQEIKGYANPPVVLVRVLVSLFVILRVEGFEAHLGEDLKGFPDSPSPKLWKFTQGNIQLSQRHPNNLLRLLSQATKAQVMEDMKVDALQVQQSHPRDELQVLPINPHYL